MGQPNFEARLRRVEDAGKRTAGAPLWTLQNWRAGRELPAAECRRRWPDAWPVIVARRAAAREAEELAGVIDER
jgi:hypothetical protein